MEHKCDGCLEYFSGYYFFLLDSECPDDTVVFCSLMCMIKWAQKVMLS